MSLEKELSNIPFAKVSHSSSPSTENIIPFSSPGTSVANIRKRLFEFGSPLNHLINKSNASKSNHLPKENLNTRSNRLQVN